MRTSSLRRVEALLYATIVATGCSDSPTGPGTPELITQLPRALTAIETALVQAGSQFGFGLMQQLVPTDPRENLFFSPLSASMALGMTMNGADGNTFDEMREVLGFGSLNQDAINESYASLLELLQGLDPLVTVEIANSVWVAQGWPILADFLERVREYFDAEVDNVDFTDPATVDRINDWVAENTLDKIDEIVKEGDFDDTTLMALLNAIYFRGDWTGAFDPKDTEPDIFTRSDGSEVEVDFMSREANYAHRWGPDFRLVEIPYGGQAYTMTLVLPDRGSTPADLIADLDAATWKGWVADLDSIGTILRLPKFEIEWEAQLNQPLTGMGMVDAFIPWTADFTRMTSAACTFIQQVRQKTYLKVNEVGAEAAAVTMVVMGGVTSGGTPSLFFDRPFILAIRERLSGAVLFMGIINDPTGQAEPGDEVERLFC